MLHLARFRPMSWSGSRAEIMATRIPVIQVLSANGHPKVSARAATAQPECESRVAAERVRETIHDKLRDERFE
jgi:hypothetical protein